MPNLPWFADWLVDHLARHRGDGLPGLMTEEGRLMYESWQDAIVSRRISRDGATAASKRLVAEPARFKRDHFPTFLTMAQEATRALDQQNGGRARSDLSTREGCELASVGCIRCGGGGLAPVQYSEPAYAAACGIPAIVSAYCVCALGRWIKANHADKAKDVAARVPDLAEVIAGRGQWCVFHMTDGEVSELTVREMIDAMITKHRAPQKAAQAVA